MPSLPAIAYFSPSYYRKAVFARYADLVKFKRYHSFTVFIYDSPFFAYSCTAKFAPVSDLSDLVKFKRYHSFTVFIYKTPFFAVSCHG